MYVGVLFVWKIKKEKHRYDVCMAKRTNDRWVAEGCCGWVWVCAGGWVKLVEVARGGLGAGGNAFCVAVSKFGSARPGRRNCQVSCCTDEQRANPNSAPRPSTTNAAPHADADQYCIDGNLRIARTYNNTRPHDNKRQATTGQACRKRERAHPISLMTSLAALNVKCCSLTLVLSQDSLVSSLFSTCHARDVAIDPLDSLAWRVRVYLRLSDALIS